MTETQPPHTAKAQKLLREAARARRAASQPTVGGQAADRQLMAMANRSEHEARAIARNTNGR
jgi:hypothetical protein